MLLHSMSCYILRFVVVDILRFDFLCVDNLRFDVLIFRHIVAFDDLRFDVLYPLRGKVHCTTEINRTEIHYDIGGNRTVILCNAGRNP